MTIRTQPEPTPEPRVRKHTGRKVLITLILITLCIGLLIWAIGRLIADVRTPSPVDIAREQAELEMLQLTSIVGKIVYVVVVSIGVLGGTVLFAFAVVSAGL